MSKLISVGKILNFHGIKGEVKMGFTAGKEDLISKLDKVFLYVDNVKKTYDVVSVRFHKNFAILKFKQVNSIDDVMEIKGLLVHIEEHQLKENLEQDEFLVRDLLNLDVYDIDGNKIGRVSDLGENRANDLLEIEKINGLRFVVPFVKEWVPVVDISNRRVVIKNSDGIDTTLNQENSNEI